VRHDHHVDGGRDDHLVDHPRAEARPPPTPRRLDHDRRRRRPAATTDDAPVALRKRLRDPGEECDPSTGQPPAVRPGRLRPGDDAECLPLRAAERRA
jgi:hypothetical protein